MCLVVLHWAWSYLCRLYVTQCTHLVSHCAALQPPLPPTPPSRQTPQTAGGSEFVPGELDAVGELEEGGEFDPDDLEEEGEAPVVEESAGEKRGLCVCMSGAVERLGGSSCEVEHSDGEQAYPELEGSGGWKQGARCIDVEHFTQVACVTRLDVY